MTSPGNTKSYYEPFSDMQAVPQPNAVEQEGDILPGDVAESYEISQAEHDRNVSNAAAEREVQIAALVAEAEAAAETETEAKTPSARDQAKEIVHDDFVRAATRMYNERYEELRTAYNNRDVYGTQLARLKIKEPIERLKSLNVTPEDPGGLWQ